MGSNVRLWLKADIGGPRRNVRFTPRSGHSRGRRRLPLMTHNGHSPSNLDRHEKPQIREIALSGVRARLGPLRAPVVATERPRVNPRQGIAPKSSNR